MFKIMSLLSVRAPRTSLSLVLAGMLLAGVALALPQHGPTLAGADGLGWGGPAPATRADGLGWGIGGR